MERVPVARLKANLAKHLDRVKAGESFVITDHGTPVGILSPVAWRERVPVRKLKASLPDYLAEVQAGRSFLITEGGKPVGVLAAVDWKAEDDEVLRELIASGGI